MITLYIFLGIIIGFSISYIFNKYSKPNTIIIPKRRGLVSRPYVMGSKSDHPTNFTVEYEVEEIERTSTRSKIKILDMVCSKDIDKEQSIRLQKMFNNSWLITTDVEWLESSIEDVRNDKINKLLK